MDAERKPGRYVALVAMMRPNQWVKNLFVLIPPFFGYKFTSLDSGFASLQLLVAFCLCASAVYVFNDLCDMAADAAHPEKRTRPLPAGTITRPEAKTLFASLSAAAVAMVAISGMPLAVIALLLLYFTINLLYSVTLKNVPVVELICVASGFVIRVIAGAVVVHIAFTGWMVVSAGLLALLMVTGKRRVDLAKGNISPDPKSALNGYSIPYLDHLIAILCGALLVFYLSFCISDHAQEKFGPLVTLTSVPLITGIFRYLYLIFVQNVGDNPTALLLKEKMIQGSVIVWAALFVYLIYLR